MIKEMLVEQILSGYPIQQVMEYASNIESVPVSRVYDEVGNIQKPRDSYTLAFVYDVDREMFYFMHGKTVTHARIMRGLRKDWCDENVMVMGRCVKRDRLEVYIYNPDWFMAYIKSALCQNKDMLEKAYKVSVAMAKQQIGRAKNTSVHFTTGSTAPV